MNILETLSARGLLKFEVVGVFTCWNWEHKHFLNQWGLSWFCYGRRASIEAEMWLNSFGMDPGRVGDGRSKLSNLMSLYPLLKKLNTSFRLMKTMQFENCTSSWMDFIDLQVMKILQHNNYVNFQVKFKKTVHQNKKQKKQKTEDMRISSEWQQHHDSVSVFTCSMACSTGRDM